MSRLLVVDRSELLAWRVAKIVPSGVQVEGVSSLSEALRILEDNPPDAAIFELSRCHSDWRTLLDACTEGEHLIPFLCVAEIGVFEACGRQIPCRQEDLIPEELPKDVFGRKIADLIRESQENDPPRFRYRRGRSTSSQQSM